MEPELLLASVSRDDRKGVVHALNLEYLQGIYRNPKDYINNPLRIQVRFEFIMTNVECNLGYCREAVLRGFLVDSKMQVNGPPEERKIKLIDEVGFHRFTGMSV